jgi:acyl-CoA dehydrogenase
MSSTHDADYHALYDTVARFTRQEIVPHIAAWESAGELPRQLHLKAGALGLFGIGYPEEFGGTPATLKLRLAVWLALARVSGSGGLFASLLTHNIGLPPVANYASKALQQRVVPAVLRGEQIICLAITEPGGGSDVAALRCTALLEGDHFIINGEKTFITSGMRADWITLAVRTGEPGSKGAGGISLLLVSANTPGINRKAWDKMGWHCSDTAHISFENVRVPADHLLGELGQGFKIIMQNFNGERLGMAAAALGFAQACYDEALAWAQHRQVFGSALSEKQVIRHKLMDMHMRICSTHAWLDALCLADAPQEQDAAWVAQVCLLKNHATQTMQFCADQAVQILGGAGYVKGSAAERIYREVKVMMIGGGAEEIMKDLAARQLAV